MATRKEIRRYEVIRDTREQNGWNFPASNVCAGTVVDTLKTGDYTVVGYQHLLCVERKGSTAEVSMNVFQKRFERELVRLEEFKYPFVVCEFTLADVVSFPFNSGIPQKKWGDLKVTPQLLMKRINEFQIKYKTKWIFAGCNGREFTSSLIKRVIESEEKDSNYFR